MSEENKVRRYRHLWQGPVIGLDISKTGDWIKYSDYKNLQKELTRTKEDLKEALELLKASQIGNSSIISDVWEKTEIFLKKAKGEG